MKKRKLKLQTRMILLVLILIVIVVAEMAITFYIGLVSTIEEQTGERALNVAKTLAGMPDIRKAFSSDEPWTVIQPIAERVRRETGAQYVVVGNRQGIRYSHPIPERIGRKMEGGDNGPALEHGRSYISKAVGSLGPSLRGKTPVFDDEGNVIGIVSVGFLLENIEDWSELYFLRVTGYLLLGLIIGTLGAVYLARDIKKATLGLEPEEISALYKERNAVIESVREGIIVIDQAGKITLMNQSAHQILSIPAHPGPIGKPIRDVLPHTRMTEVLHSGEKELDRNFTIHGKELVVNRYPIRSGKEGPVNGVVASFRLKSEMDELNEQLSQVSRYTEALRAQTHEFNNTLYTISGLIQLGSHREALDLIHRETVAGQDLIQLIMKRIPDPWLGGILLGFFNRAKELKVEFIMDPDSSLQHLSPGIQRHCLVSMLGNLITNAFEAVEQNPEGERKVKVYLGDWGQEILLEVEDSGPGVSEKATPYLFQRGYSTKTGDDRGLGLPKVKELAEEMGGYVTIEKGEWGGALFTITLPKGGKSGGERVVFAESED